METTELTMFRNSVQQIESNIAVKPFCTFFGLNFQNQVERIKRDPVLNQLYGNFRTVGADFKQREMFCLTKRGFIRWIDRINPQNVAENLRENFIRFQILIDDYLYGSEQDNEQMRLNYTRLKKLRQLYAKVGREIQRVDTEVKCFLDNRYIQLSFEFNKNQLKEKN